MKRSLVFLPLVILMAFTLGCQDQQALAELEEIKAQAEVEEQNKAMVQRLLSEGDKRGAGILDEVCAPDYKMYFPSNADPIGLEEHKQVWQSFTDAFPDLEHTIHQSIAEGDVVSTRETLRGTHEGEFEGIPPTGNTVVFGAVCLWRFADGKLVEYRADADLLGLFQQLGMELSPAAVEE